jgi:hypothetical protein
MSKNEPRCVVCHRKMNDALSIEVGMGPECRDRFSYPDSVALDVQDEVVQLVRSISVAQPDISMVESILKLHIMGLTALADHLELNLIPVVITEEQGRLLVRTSYHYSAVEAFKAIPGRRWDAAKGVNKFPMNAKAAIFGVLKKFYLGSVALGPKGAFIVK